MPWKTKTLIEIMNANLFMRAYVSHCHDMRLMCERNIGRNYRRHLITISLAHLYEWLHFLPQCFPVFGSRCVRARALAAFNISHSSYWCSTAIAIIAKPIYRWSYWTGPQSDVDAIENTHHYHISKYKTVFAADLFIGRAPELNYRTFEWVILSKSSLLCILPWH